MRVVFKIVLVFLFCLYFNNIYALNSNIHLGNFYLKDIKFTKYNNSFVIYDFIFPTMVRFSIINDNDKSKEKILKTIKFINFYSTPGKFYRFKGLGSGGPWWKNSSLMLSSGNLLCSEQSSLATLILRIDFRKFALRDVQAHTFHEVKVDNRWIILDPIFDNRIRNYKNQIVSFNDIQKYLHGKHHILKLPKHISKRTEKYFSLFKKENYKPVRMAFGQHLVFPEDKINIYLGLSVKKFIKILKKNKLYINKKLCYPYLIFIRNNLIYILKNVRKNLREQLINQIQDYFFNAISKEFMRGWIPEKVDKLFIARNYQFLGRFQDALKIFKTFPQNNKQIAFYISQIYFKSNNKKQFNRLQSLLSKNIFYRYMYWLLNKKYLLHSDEKDFDKFAFKLVDYDKILVKYGTLNFK